MNNKIKRRKSKYNPYQLEISNQISFIDSRGNKQRVRVNDTLYKEFDTFELNDLKEMNEYDRHIEHLEQTEESLYHNTLNQYISLEDIVLKKIIYEKLYQEIEKLPKVQRRRLKMYYFDQLTLREIALKENCSCRAIKYSIDIAIKKISKKMKI